MRVFIGNLPADFTSLELRKLVYNTLTTRNVVQLFRNILKKTHKIKRTAVELINEEQGYYEAPFGVVFIEPDIIGYKLIQCLDKHYIRGKVLVVREFYVRAYINDRRAVNWRRVPWDKNERRLVDRRLGVIAPKTNSI